MAKNDFSAESPENPEEKCTCALVIDTSGSMSGRPINELNDAIQNFHEEIKQDTELSEKLEVSLITFDSVVETLVEPSLGNNFSMPTLDTGGSTKLVDGVREGIDKVEARKDWYKQTGQPHKRPWVILMTDGAPDSDQDIDGLSQEIEEGAKGKHFVFFPVGVQDANMDVLKQLSIDVTMEDGEKWEVPPAKLQGLKFKEFFEWLSNSLKGVAEADRGDKVDMPDPQDWMEGFEV